MVQSCAANKAERHADCRWTLRGAPEQRRRERRGRTNEQAREDRSNESRLTAISRKALTVEIWKDTVAVIPDNVAERSPVRAILIGGLIAGALDITYACVFFGIRNHVSPIRIFQSVARGALGQTAFQGGLKTAALGLFFHFLIALIAAA